MMGLQCGFDSFTICFSVATHCQTVRDRRTDRRQTFRSTTAKILLCNASRGSLTRVGIRTFSLDISPSNISPARTFPTPFLHGVGHSPYHHHHAPIYIKRSTVNVYKIDTC